MNRNVSLIKLRELHDGEHDPDDRRRARDRVGRFERCACRADGRHLQSVPGILELYDGRTARAARHLLPLPPASTATVVKPLRTAAYWHRAMDGQNFEWEDDLDTDAFNEALWAGLRGDEPYPVVRYGKDLGRNRAALLKEHEANRLWHDAARVTDVSSR